MYDLITIGDTTLDLFIKPQEAKIFDSGKKGIIASPFEKILCFNLGDKVSIEKVDYSLGGTACNVAVGLKRLGVNSGLISYCGNDLFGAKIQELLRKENISLADFKVKNKIHSTYAFILYTGSDRTILVYYNKDQDDLHLNKIKKTKWLYLGSLTSGYVKDVVALAAEKNIHIAINPSKHQLEKKRKDFMLLLKLAEIVILNKEEAEILIGARFPLTIKEIYYKIASLGINNLILTDGENGAYARVTREIIHQPAIKAKAVESTGAGDAFSSGFLATYIKETDIKKALLWGVTNGAKVVEKIGAQTGLLNKTEIENE